MTIIPGKKGEKGQALVAGKSQVQIPNNKQKAIPQFSINESAEVHYW
jgi:hypothetical protein